MYSQFWDLERARQWNIFWNAKYKRYYNATRCVNSWGDLGDWSAGFPDFQVQYSHWFLCWWPCCLHLKYPRSGDYADWSPGFPMSKMKGKMCNFVLVWVFECGVLFVILSTSVIVEQIRLLVKGAPVLSVSLTSLPYPGVGDPKWAFWERVYWVWNIIRRQNHWQKLAR